VIVFHTTSPLTEIARGTPPILGGEFGVLKLLHMVFRIHNNPEMIINEILGKSKKD